MLSQVPDLCLLNIMKHLPIRDLLHSGQTCHRWRAFKKVSCTRRTRLTLRFGDRALDSVPQFDTIHLNGPLTREQCVQLATEQLPSIVDLTITMASAVRPVKILDSIPSLLEYWSDTLISLALNFDFGHKYVYSYQKQLDMDVDGEKTLMDRLYRLFGATLHEQLPTLTRLSIDCLHEMKFSNSSSRLMMPILGRLREFYFHSLDDFWALLGSSLCVYAKLNPRLALVEVSNQLNSNYSLERMLLHVPPSVSRVFTMLNYPTDSGRITMQQLRQFGSNFTALTRLGLSLYGSDYGRFTETIVRLNCSLTHLKLFVHFFRQLPRGEEEDNGNRVALASVTSLELSVWCTHDDLATLSIGQVFPSVREIGFKVYRCESCNLNYTADKEVLEPSVDALVQPLLGVQCPNVERIVGEYEYNDTFRKVYVK